MTFTASDIPNTISFVAENGSNLFRYMMPEPFVQTLKALGKKE